MIPLYEEYDDGTDYMVRYRLNPFALFLIACGWEIDTFVYHVLDRR